MKDIPEKDQLFIRDQFLQNKLKFSSYEIIKNGEVYTIYPIEEKIKENEHTALIGFIKPMRALSTEIRIKCF